MAKNIMRRSPILDTKCGKWGYTTHSRH